MTASKRSRTRRRRGVWLWFAIVGVMAAGGHLLYRSSSATLRAGIDQAQEQELWGVRVSLEHEVAAVVRRVEDLAMQPVMLEILDEDVDHRIGTLLEKAAQASGNLLSIGCWNTAGDLVALGGDAASESREQAQPPDGLDDLRAIIEPAAEWFDVWVGVTAQFDEPESTGVLRARYAWKALRPPSAHWWAGLADTEGRVLGQRGPRLGERLDPLRQEQSVPGQPLLETRWARVALPEKVKAPAWYAVVADPEDVLYASVGVLGGAVFFMTLGMAAVVLLLILISSRRQERLMRRLETTAIDLSATAEALRGEVEEHEQTNEDLREAKIRADAATTAKSAFLANMSHEIRTPMNAIIGLTDLLSELDLGPEARDYVETIRISGEALLAIINDILDFSKIEAGKIALEAAPFSLRDCVEEAVSLVAGKAGEKKLELVWLVGEDLPDRIVGDVTRTRQILINLLNNAVKFTATGEVAVTVCREARPCTPGSADREAAAPEEAEKTADSASSLSVHFTVRDTGIGIPRSRVGRLFEAFTQADSSTTRNYGGTGLGLSISKRLCELMGGRIWVESEEGKGSTFHFTIAVEAAEMQERAPEGLLESSLAGKRILVVDDNETNRRVLEVQTRSWGMDPRLTGSPLEALSWLEKGESFDLILLDMQMPEMSGEELARRIAVDGGLAVIPVVLLSSAFERPRGEVEPLFAAWHQKPVRRKALRETLVRVLAAGTPARTPASACAATEICSLEVLLVDDNAINRKVGTRILEKQGCRPDTANDGREAIEAVRAKRYDLVLMDVQMPVMDGLEAARHIRREWNDEERPVIVAMTANATEEDRKACLEAGMDDYLRKPVRAAALRKLLDDVARRKAKAGRARAGSS